MFKTIYSILLKYDSILCEIVNFLNSFDYMNLMLSSRQFYNLFADNENLIVNVNLLQLNIEVLRVINEKNYKIGSFRVVGGILRLSELGEEEVDMMKQLIHKNSGWLRGYELPRDDFLDFGKLKNLREVVIGEVQPYHSEGLKKLKKLRTLTFSFNEKTDISVFPSCLTSIDVLIVKFSHEKFLEMLKKFESLRCLRMEFHVNEDTRDCPKEFFRFVCFESSIENIEVMIPRKSKNFSFPLKFIQQYEIDRKRSLLLDYLSPIESLKMTFKSIHQQEAFRFICNLPFQTKFLKIEILGLGWIDKSNIENLDFSFMKSNYSSYNLKHIGLDFGFKLSSSALKSLEPIIALPCLRKFEIGIIVYEYEECLEILQNSLSDSVQSVILNFGVPFLASFSSFMDSLTMFLEQPKKLMKKFEMNFLQYPNHLLSSNSSFVATEKHYIRLIQVLLENYEEVKISGYQDEGLGARIRKEFNKKLLNSIRL